MNVQVIKDGPALALVLIASTAQGLPLADGQWCAANVAPGTSPTVWEGPSSVPTVGGSTTAGSGTLSQPTAGSYSLSYITVPGLGTKTELNSKLFLQKGGQLFESQEFDLVDAAPPPVSSSIAVPTLTATPSLPGNVPSLLLQGF